MFILMSASINAQMRDASKLQVNYVLFHVELKVSSKLLINMASKLTSFCQDATKDFPTAVQRGLITTTINFLRKVSGRLFTLFPAPVK